MNYTDLNCWERRWELIGRLSNLRDMGEAHGMTLHSRGRANEREASDTW